MSNYYAETAYDSRKEHTPIEESEEHWKPSRFNGAGLKWGNGFGWFFSISEFSPSKFNKYSKIFKEASFQKVSGYHKMLDSRHEDKDSKNSNGLNHDHMVCLSSKGGAMILAVLFLLLRGMLIIYALGFCFIAIIENKLEYITDTGTLLFFAFLALLCYVVCFKKRLV